MYHAQNYSKWRPLVITTLLLISFTTATRQPAGRGLFACFSSADSECQTSQTQAASVVDKGKKPLYLEKETEGKTLHQADGTSLFSRLLDKFYKLEPRSFQDLTPEDKIHYKYVRETLHTTESLIPMKEAWDETLFHLMSRNPRKRTHTWKRASKCASNAMKDIRNGIRRLKLGENVEEFLKTHSQALLVFRVEIAPPHRRPHGHSYQNTKIMVFDAYTLGNRVSIFITPRQNHTSLDIVLRHGLDQWVIQEQSYQISPMNAYAEGYHHFSNSFDLGIGFRNGGLAVQRLDRFIRDEGTSTKREYGLVRVQNLYEKQMVAGRFDPIVPWEIGGILDTLRAGRQTMVRIHDAEVVLLPYASHGTGFIINAATRVVALVREEFLKCSFGRQHASSYEAYLERTGAVVEREHNLSDSDDSSDPKSMREVRRRERNSNVKKGNGVFIKTG